MEAVVLAGGLGVRLRGAVPDAPKPMAPVNGRPFLEHQMDYWISQGITRFILSTGYKSAIIEKHFEDRHKTAEIDYAIEEKPLGTGGGLLLAALKTKKSPFLVLNGDTYFEAPLERLCLYHGQMRADVTICLLRVPKNDRYGCVELEQDGAIKSFKAHTGNTRENLINGGVYLISKQALNDIGKSPGEKALLEDDIFPDMIRTGGRVYGFPCEGAKFIDIGVPEDYKAAGKLFGYDD